MEPKAYLYAIPREYYEKYGVRRYGFHGTSHSFVSKETIKFANLDPKTAKVIVCHLGNGASISASVGGKCVDTSMGLTPLEGLIMGTRSGDLDPAILEFLCNHENLTISEMLNILNKKSGVLGMSGGISSDFRDLNAAANDGNEIAKVTLEAYAYRVAKYIGAYTAAMNGVDAITFTAGVGENAAWLRPMVAKYLGYLGVELDEAASEKACGVEGIISTPESKVKLCVIPTNEELAIARETLALVK
jgi:acetate kinase